MKKILKHFRKNWYRYGLETLVVIVGVLIAFSLNNWNENSRNQHESKQVLENLLLESQFNLDEVRENIQRTKSAAYSGLRLMELVSSGKFVSNHEIDSLIFNFIGIPSLNTSNGALMDVISTGKINLLQNDSLRLLLLSFNGRIDKINEHEKRTNEVLQRSLVGYLYEHYAFTKMDTKFHQFDVDWPKGKFKVDINVLFEDIKFENLTDDITYRELQLLEYYEDIESYIQLVINSIDKELKTN